MKFYNNKYLQLSVLASLMLCLFSCERELSDDVVLATFPTNGDVYTDAPVGLTDEFFISFDPAFGANPEAFGTDDDVSFEGSSSIRIDVPAPNDPNGSFVGGIFLDRGAGRDLSGYDALTFYAKGSVTATVGDFGFGSDFDQDRFPVAIQNTQLSTDWRKYTIPIPDASKLTQERGMFRFSAGAFDVNNTPGDPSDDIGYTFWIDEIRFEKLGTVAQPRPSIFNGEDISRESFIGVSVEVPGTVTFNLANGQDQLVTPSSAYFNYESSDTSVVTIDENGLATVVGTGVAVITASLNGVAAQGSLTLNSLGSFVGADVPTRPAANVISVFSDAYNNVPVDYYNGFFNADGQTTQGGAPPLDINGDMIINYTQLNFVGIGTFLDVQPVNASNMTHMHVDINVQEAIDPGDFIRIQLLNGVQSANETSGSITLSASDLATNDWRGFDIPLADFTGLGGTDALGLIFFISDTTISNIFVDNIYYYRE
jgi:hypothetical protein